MALPASEASHRFQRQRFLVIAQYRNVEHTGLKLIHILYLREAAIETKNPMYIPSYNAHSYSQGRDWNRKPKGSRGKTHCMSWQLLCTHK
jgi:hypothetical protein